MKKFNQRLMWLVVVAALLWLCAELVRVSGEVRAASGWAGLPFDGVVQHKVGELLIAIPFAAVTLLTYMWEEGRLLLLIRRTRAAMWLGGILNGVAWLSLRHIKVWHPYCLLLLVFGLVGPWVAGLLVRKTKAAEAARRQ
jgi:hypothetical protein